MAETFLLKHILSPRLIEVMGRNIKSVYLEFDALGFSEASVSQLDGLALKQRAIMIAEKLHEYLPNHYPAAIEILMQTMDVELVDEDNLGRYNEFYFLPFAEFIAAYGLNHLPESVLAMNKLTKVFTSEFCIRPFIQRYPAEMMRILSEWVCDDNKHVRRLVSEGTRTRLPWAGRLPEFQANPQPVLDLLEKLKQDPELYVRRSVANNLNDIAKDNPDIVIQTLIRWNKIDDEGTQYIVRHASRTLIKAGHPEALVLLGFDPKSPIELLDFKVDGLVQFGGKLKFEFKIQNTDSKAHDYVIDFVIYFKKANGNQAPKVFKLNSKRLKAGEVLYVQKTHPIKPISTRKYYNGMQSLAIQVNGLELAIADFELKGVG